MAFTFGGMLTEFYARGFSYLDDGAAGATRASRWINDGMHTIDDLADWPYLRAQATGTAPLVISDLRRIQSVTDINNLVPLSFMDERTVTDYYVNTALTGSYGLYYYLTAGTTVNAFPVSGASLTVRYTKVAPDLVGLTDEPLMPDRYRMAIVHYAVASALADDDNYEEAQAATALGDGMVARMRDALLTQAGESDQQVITNFGGDW